MNAASTIRPEHLTQKRSCDTMARGRSERAGRLSSTHRPWGRKLLRIEVLGQLPRDDLDLVPRILGQDVCGGQADNSSAEHDDSGLRLARFRCSASHGRSVSICC